MGEPRWQREGTEPDYRFSLANERTFLAWIRTALALLAGAVAVIQFLPPSALVGTRTALAAMLATGGSLLPIAAYRRWSRIQHAMRLGHDLPFTPLLLVVSSAIGLAGAGLFVLALVS
jgi:putative membrane protein